MSRFVSDKTTKIFLPNQDGSDSEEWVTLRTSFGFEEIVGVNESSETKAQVSINLLAIAMTSWNLKDEDGTEAPLNIENIKRLDVSTVSTIMKCIESNSNLKEFSSTGSAEEDKKKLRGSTLS